MSILEDIKRPTLKNVPLPKSKCALVVSFSNFPPQMLNKNEINNISVTFNDIHFDTCMMI